MTDLGYEMKLLRRVEVPDAVADIVFVHDLTQDPSETWKMPDGRLWPKAKKIRDANRFVFEYNFGSLTTLKDIVSTQRLLGHAQNLMKALRSTIEKPARHVLLVGYGYGGLICEQAATLLDVQSDSRKVNGILLFGTPHFHAGLAQWANMTAKRENIPCRETPQLDSWSKCDQDMAAIKEMQTKFCQILNRTERSIELACCFTKRPKSKGNKLEEHKAETGPMISPEWCILPRARPIAINSIHSEMTNLDSKDQTLTIVLSVLNNWMEELRKNGKLDNKDPLAGGDTERDKDPARHNDPVLTIPITEKWMQDFRSINAWIVMQRRLRRLPIETGIRVAILDTGLDRSLPFFCRHERSHRIAESMDFVHADGSSAIMDASGHGTLMTRLVMECAPLADILVARVTKSNRDIEGSQENIAKAILWAGLVCKADIISMSFYFPESHEGISRAIKTVASERNGDIIFLASAGYSPTMSEGFPARLSSVIPIYATNSYGDFIEWNPRISAIGRGVLGTFGDVSPADIFKDFEKKYPNLRPSSSVATAVAAAICAIMLAYAKILPVLVGKDSKDIESSERVLKRLWGSKGMEALFYKMAKVTSHRRWFVSPIPFWRDIPDDLARYAAIYDCLETIQD